ncbi:MAG: hypothetical protein U5L09_22470 [Bacteroidales bacterium]|nr:hypothetical protein [Bacteroidales bacterium]
MNKLGRFEENYKVVSELAKKHPKEHIIQNNLAESSDDLAKNTWKPYRLDATLALKSD